MKVDGVEYLPVTPDGYPYWAAETFGAGWVVVRNGSPETAPGLTEAEAKDIAAFRNEVGAEIARMALKESEGALAALVRNERAYRERGAEDGLRGRVWMALADATQARVQRLGEHLAREARLRGGRR